MSSRMGAMTVAGTSSALPSSGARLHSVEFINFKSYGGRRVIGPFRDFTCVVGPNGAGKSNVMDGISFGAGMETKDLRGKKLKDLVYRGPNDTGNEERSASVALIFELNGKKHIFKRSITVAGVGEYRIDNKVVKAEVYLKRLKDFGIHTKAHLGFLVFQGYVSELAAKSPMELTHLFEQISGSDEYKEEYERLEREKKKADEDQIYNYQKKKGLAQERTSMRKQKEEAEKYTELIDTRKELQQRLYLFRMLQVEKEIASLRAQAAEARTAADADAAKHAEIEEAVKSNEKEKARLGRKLIELERRTTSLQQEIDGKTPEAIRLREEIAHAEKRKKMSEKSLEKVKEQQQKGAEQLANLQSELDEVESSIQRLTDEADDGDEHGELSLGTKQRAEYNQLKAQAGAATAAIQEQIGRKKRDLRGLEPSVLTLRTRVEELTAEKATVEAKVNALEERRVAGTEKTKELSASLKDLQAQSTQLTSSSKSSRERRAALESRLADVVGQLRSSKAEHRETERERRRAEAAENLTRLFPGVYGRMTDICKPTQRRYHAAVTIAMGKNMDAVVVDTERTAMDCITYLKEKKCAPETFIPLDTIRARPVREAMRQLGGSKKPAQDVISAPEQYLKAVQFAVGDAVICDSLEEARQLAYHSSGEERFKVVTTDGTLINKAGLITGGSSPQEKARANKWNQKEHDALKVEQEKIRRELDELGLPMAAEEKELALRHAVGSKQQEVQTAQSDLDLTKAKLTKHKKELTTIGSSLETARTQLVDLESKVDKGKAEASELQERADAEEDRIFSKFSASLGIASVREYEEKHVRAAREREAQLLSLKQQQSKLKAQLLFEGRKDLPAAIRKLEASIAEDAKTIAKKREKQAKAEKSSEGLKAEADKAEAETQQVTAAQEKAVSELKSLKKELRGAADKMGAARVKLTQLENDMDQQRGQRQRIFQRARLEEVTLPLATGDMDAADDGGDGGGDGGGGGKKPGGKKAKRKRDSSSDGAVPAPHVTELMASESFSPSGLVGTATMDGVDVDDEAAGSSGGGRSGGGDAGDDGAEQPVRIDFSSLDEHERAEDAATFEANLNSQIGDAAKQVEGMAPNMKALTQYEEVQARLHSMETEFDTSRSTAKSISQQFAAVQAKRYAAFMSAFKHIAEHIDDVYKELTQVEGVPLGGTAYLSLEDPSEPYLHGTKYTAMPAGKRFRDMDQLSGGERTIAALALLFAVHKYRPSPFFVMDEIDAALDNVNVTRVAQFIRERAAEGSLQFVVISLKDNFYQMAHGLVGIFRDRREEASSCVTIDLEALDVEQEAEDEL